MVALSALALALSAASLAAAQSTFKITNPSADHWWVAESSNVLTWDCKNNPHTTFGVFIANADQTLFAGDLAIIPQQPNADCSKEITHNQVNQPPGSGYIIKFANAVNSSEVFAQSDQFEIRPLGSAFPTTSSPAGNSPSNTADNTAAGASSTDTPNGAASLKTLGIGFTAAAAGALAYLM
ncbi:hypothetical protein AGABI1DRAFT_130950 [Agaricus bisporus var. burnettii JB137-S8]|uniref:Yeast cell wall synthesis Kre9/Knh1-like N-terminal domain-containing protein n=2 Tax=Agaricus bisporus var. burnettii TaxID=192524 RepID=K5X1C6_AGABU|nr:uncharacterized protein AGABI1DRAFT_130950 [Agaricus bisporus var. burnettii JB137-S8]EKM76943.1 hypothetical protein AGABI1DRAFT_130950 [Agaricus bisporus var. burnettii JB137-S8]KAF7761905.1 hypothetical protein Agabi119p4_9897 [Agaricus bisporus var. burnettii]